MREFQELGDRIEREWRARQYRDTDLPEISVRTLTEMNLPSSLGALDVLEWLHTTASIPSQQDRPAEFSNLPVTVYHGPRFYIAVLYWLDGITTVHQHGFEGAFQVLGGSSMHGEFAFAEDREVSQHLLTGTLSLDRMELLSVGSTRPILRGRAFLHSLFHLDHPSATIVVRSYISRRAGPQYNYVQPGIAWDPFLEDEFMQRRLQSVRVLLGMQRPEGLKLFETFLESSEFHTCYLALEQFRYDAPDDSLARMFGLPNREETLDRLVAAVKRRHGELADLLPSAFEAESRKLNVVARRRVVTDPEHRYFLAVLLNAPTRETALDLIRARFPDEEPVEKTLDLIDELLTTRVAGATRSVLDAEFLDGDALFVLRCLLEGRSPQGIEAAVAEEYGEARAAEVKARIPTVVDELRKSILSPLATD